MKKRLFLKNNKYKELVFALMTLLVFGLVFYKIFENIGVFTGFVGKVVSLSMSFVYGIVIAYVLNPLVKLIEKKFKLNRGIAIGLTYAIFIVIISVVALFGLPSLIENIKELMNNLPNYIASAQEFTYSILEKPEVKDIISTTGALDNLQEYISKFGTVMMGILEGSFITIFSLSSQIVKFILGLLVSIYVLIDKDRLIREWKRVLFLAIKEERAKKVIELGRVYHKMIGTYIGIKAIDSSIIGGMAFILLTLVKSEYALLLSIIVGITNMIPYFGPFVGEIVGFLINVFVSPVKGLVVFLVLFSLQMFDGWYLDPKLIGNKVGVRPFWIIYAVVIGGGFFGPIGMLLASPTAATLKIYYQKLLDKNKELLKNVDK